MIINVNSKKYLIILVIIVIVLSTLFAWVKINHINIFKKVRPVDFTGIWVRNDKEGKKYQEVTFKNGKKNGLITIYYPNGNKKVTGQYQRNIKVGEWVYFNEQKNKLKTELYEKDILREVYKDYDTQGLHQKSLHYNANQYLISERAYELGKEVSREDIKP